MNDANEVAMRGAYGGDQFPSPAQVWSSTEVLSEYFGLTTTEVHVALDAAGKRKVGRLSSMVTWDEVIEQADWLIAQLREGGHLPPALEPCDDPAAHHYRSCEFDKGNCTCTNLL